MRILINNKGKVSVKGGCELHYPKQRNSGGDYLIAPLSQFFDDVII